ncbi:MAG: hypothetical protein ABEN55_00565 [Bradymonadaceae bacterium]
MAKVRDIDKGYDRISDLVKKMDGGRVTIGVHAKDNEPYVRGQDDSATIAQIATFHEFGAPKANIPQRSFMRSTLDDNSREYFSMAERLFGLVVDGDIRPKRALRLLGQRIMQDIQQRIVDLQTPPLKPETIEAKKRGYGRVQNADVEPDQPILAVPDPSGGGVQDSGNPLVDTGQMKNAIDFEVSFPRVNGAVA